MLTRIKKIGGYCDLDDGGYIINPASTEKINPKFTPIIERIIAFYKDVFKDDINSIYLRGSLPRGMFVNQISDIDSFALIKRINTNWQSVSEGELESLSIISDYPFIRAIDFKVNTYNDNFAKEFPYVATMIKTQSICIFGTNISSLLPKARIDRYLVLNIHIYSETYKRVLKNCEENYENLLLFRYFMKITIKSAFELTIYREKMFTTDLYYCYKSFIRLYPAKKIEIREVFVAFLNPDMLSCGFILGKIKFFKWLQNQILTTKFDF